MILYRPPAAFSFKVSFTGVQTDEDCSFADVSGLDAERPLFEIHEGGENRYSHKVPERARFGNLTLKRGLLVWTSDLAKWCKEILESDLAAPIAPKEITITLTGQKRESLLEWNVIRAWPVKWGVSSLAADRNEVAIDTLELAHAGFLRIRGEKADDYLKPEAKPAK